MIPPSLREIVSAARAVAVAHLAVKRGRQDEVPPHIAKKKLEALYTACEKLCAALQAAELDLKAMRAAGGIDWGSIAKTLTGFAGLVREAKAGTLDAKKAVAWVEGEVVDFERGRT